MYKDRIIVPKLYKSKLSVIETEIAIKELKDFFERELSKALNLIRVSAPLFVKKYSGVNDDLNGLERAVTFDIKEEKDEVVEIVHSLAKWKRMALDKYGFSKGKGLYTDMNAIRRDEDLDNIHSVYVDQWDWEKIISKEERTEETLRQIVTTIYSVFQKTEEYISKKYTYIKPMLPKDIFFITAQELEDMYPNLTAKEREDAICKKKKAVFIQGIGGKLKSGKKHDGRSPDYDDWNLNGDILFYYEEFDKALELSSMGIRVDEKALSEQLEIANCKERKKFTFHKNLLEGKLPYTIGGGIGQSRICMFFLRKAHIGEVQSSIWPDEMIEFCEENNIYLL